MSKTEEETVADSSRAGKIAVLARSAFSAIGLIVTAGWILALAGTAIVLALGMPRQTIFVFQHYLYMASLGLFLASVARLCIGIMYGLFRLAQDSSSGMFLWAIVAVVAAGLLTAVLATIRLAQGFVA